MEDNKKILTGERKTYIILGIALLIALIAGFSYALWQYYAVQRGENKVGAGCFDLTITDNGSPIDLSRSLPMTEVQGKATSPYEITISNDECTIDAGYQINVEVLEDSTILPSNVRVAVDDRSSRKITFGDETTPSITGATSSYTHYTGELAPGESVTHAIRGWFDENMPALTNSTDFIEFKISIVAVPVEPLCLECGILMAAPGYDIYNNNFFYIDGLPKSDVEEIVFVTTNVVPQSGIIDSVDVSEANDGSVMLWWESIGTDGRFKVSIGSNGGVIAPNSTRYMFSSMENLKKIDLTNFYTHQTTNMERMFYFAGRNSSSFSLNLGDHFDTSKVTNMYWMFWYTGAASKDFTLDLGNKFDTSQVNNMGGMFNSTGYESTVFTLNLGNKFDTSQVMAMEQMFYYMGYKSTVITLDLGNKFDTSQVTRMNDMFGRVGFSNPNFTLNLGDNFTTPKVTTMSNMFNNTGRKSENFELNMKTMSFENNPRKTDMLYGILATSTIYVKDQKAANFILDGSGLISGATIVDCSANTCP